MSTVLTFERDAQGYNAYAPRVSTDLYSATLASAGHATVTVPSNYEVWIVNFSFQPGSDIWVAYNATAAAPAGATFATTTSELLPAQRRVLKATVIDLYNNGPNSADIGIAFYAIS